MYTLELLNPTRNVYTNGYLCPLNKESLMNNEILLDYPRPISGQGYVCVHFYLSAVWFDALPLVVSVNNIKLRRNVNRNYVVSEEHV